MVCFDQANSAQQPVPDKLSVAVVPVYLSDTFNSSSTVTDTARNIDTCRCSLVYVRRSPADVLT